MPCVGEANSPPGRHADTDGHPDAAATTNCAHWRRGRRGRRGQQRAPLPNPLSDIPHGRIGGFAHGTATTGESVRKGLPPNTLLARGSNAPQTTWCRANPQGVARFDERAEGRVGLAPLLAASMESVNFGICLCGREEREACGGEEGGGSFGSLWEWFT